MSQSGPPERASLASALEEEEARLRRLEAERAGAKARADALRAQLAALDEAPVLRGETVTTSVTAPRSPTEKVRLFRQLFRGRDDLYPTRYVSKKTGKPGYAPACSNKWEVGLCALKTGGKCSDCTNQAFRQVDDLAVPWASAWQARDGRLRDAPRRDVLVPRGRLRQEHLEGGRGGIR